jgi:hypothetical protein
MIVESSRTHSFSRKRLSEGNKFKVGEKGLQGDVYAFLENNLG